MNDPRTPIVPTTSAAVSSASSEIDWKKILGIGAVVVVGGAVLYYLLGGSERRSSLKEAEQKFDEASAKKEEEDWEAAEKLYLESLSILRRMLDKNDENLAEVFRELAACALNKMDLDRAEHYSYECLKIKEHNHGHNSPLICESLVNLAGILAALKSSGALEYAQRARSIYEIPSEDKRDYAGLSHALRTIAAIIMRTDLAKAQETALLSIEYLDKVGYTPETKQDYYRDAMEGHILLAKIYTKQENIEAAESVYKGLVQKARDVLGVDVFVAYALRNLGDFYADRGLLDQAEAAYKEAVEEVQQRNGSDNSTVIAFINYLAHFYWDHQRDAEAREVFETLRSMTSLPSPTNSRCLVTRLFAFTFVRSKEDAHLIEPVYVGELLPTSKLPQDAFLEVFYENPQDPANPILQERQLTPDDKDAIVLLSPPVKGVTRRMYEIAIHIYSDASKSTKLGEHHQMCQSVFETDQIRTEDDLMKQIPKDRLI